MEKIVTHKTSGLGFFPQGENVHDNGREKREVNFSGALEKLVKALQISFFW